MMTCVAGHSLDTVEPELKALANSALEEAQRPDAYVQIDDIPATPTGKVRRATLRDMVIDHPDFHRPARDFRWRARPTDSWTSPTSCVRA